MKVNGIFFLFLFLNPVFYGLGFQQNNGNVKLNGTGTQKILSAYKGINEAKKTIPGFRVQIHVGGEREKAKEMKSKFLSQYANLQAYESYQSPNFRLRVGDFRTRIEAIKFQKKIVSVFPTAYVVADLINLPNLTVDTQN